MGGRKTSFYNPLLLYQSLYRIETSKIMARSLRKNGICNAEIHVVGPDQNTLVYSPMIMTILIGRMHRDGKYRAHIV